MTIDRKRKQHDVVSSWTIAFFLAKSVSHVACFFSDTPGIYSEVGPMWHGMCYPKQGHVCLKRYQFFHFGGVVLINLLH